VAASRDLPESSFTPGDSLKVPECGASAPKELDAGAPKEVVLAVLKELGEVENLSEEGANTACGRAGAPKDHADVVEAFGLPAKLGRCEDPNSEVAVSVSTGEVVEATAAAAAGAGADLLKLRRPGEKKESMFVSMNVVND